jgi:hypothetical protein
MTDMGSSAGMLDTYVKKEWRKLKAKKLN